MSNKNPEFSPLLPNEWSQAVGHRNQEKLMVQQISWTKIPLRCFRILIASQIASRSSSFSFTFFFFFIETFCTCSQNECQCHLLRPFARVLVPFTLHKKRRVLYSNNSRDACLPKYQLHPVLIRRIPPPEARLDGGKLQWNLVWRDVPTVTSSEDEDPLAATREVNWDVEI